jgi:hypothetical protein
LYQSLSKINRFELLGLEAELKNIATQIFMALTMALYDGLLKAILLL